MPEIAVRTNASTAWGMGHTLRQRHLAAVLRERGHRLTFYISDHSASNTLLKNAGFDVRVVDADSGLPEGANPYDAVILDVRDTEADAITRLRRRTPKIVSFEDWGGGRNYVDLLIDCNLQRTDAKEVATGMKALFGLDHSVLAPEFETYHAREKPVPERIGSLLVTMGGTDPNGLTLKFAELLAAAGPELTVTFLAGPGYRNPEMLERAAACIKTFRVVRSAENMAALIFAHDALFCCGGVTLHEALAVGTPACVISQVPHQETNARGIEQKGGCINLGLPEDFDPATIAKLLHLDRDRRIALSRTGKRLIDGRGIHRIADAIEDLIEK